MRDRELDKIACDVANFLESSFTPEERRKIIEKTMQDATRNRRRKHKPRGIVMPSARGER